MKFVRFLIIVFCSALLIAAGRSVHKAQNSNPASSQRVIEPDRLANITDNLRTLLAPDGVSVRPDFSVPTSRNYRQVLVHWQNSASSGSESLERQTGPGSLSVTGSVEREGTLSMDRSLEWSTAQLLAVAVDKDGNLRWWKQMLDPRLIRAEVPSASGELHGEEWYLPTVDFAIAYPDDLAITEIRLYHPAWNGKEFVLEPVGVVNRF